MRNVDFNRVCGRKQEEKISVLHKKRGEFLKCYLVEGKDVKDWKSKMKK